MIQDCLNPIWNESFHLPWDGRSHLKVEVYDQDVLSNGDSSLNLCWVHSLHYFSGPVLAICHQNSSANWRLIWTTSRRILIPSNWLLTPDCRTSKQGQFYSKSQLKMISISVLIKSARNLVNVDFTGKSSLLIHFIDISNLVNSLIIRRFIRSICNSFCWSWQSKAY